MGTAGCIGLPEERVRALQDFSRVGAVLAVLPETALERFSGCLPAATVRPPHSPARIDKRNHDGGAGHRLAIDDTRARAQAVAQHPHHSQRSRLTGERLYRPIAFRSE